jgi:hypothetical protein
VSRIHFRPPGIKTGTRIGPLGPFRGRLGIHWVIGSIAVGLVILLVGTWTLFRADQPEPPYRPVGAIETFPVGQAREVLGGVFVGVAEGGEPYAVAEPANCPLEATDSGYTDCLGVSYGWDGGPLGRGDPLQALPLQVHRGQVYVDPTGDA